MTLGEIIEFLEKQDQSKIVTSGWGKGSAHSYRGLYCDLSFSPRESVTIAEMLAEAKSAVGKTFEGYKGGDFTMRMGTDCYLAPYGCCGDEISRPYLEVLCGVGPMIERAIAEAVAAERERCAKVCEDKISGTFPDLRNLTDADHRQIAWDAACEELAAAIRNPAP